MSRHGRAAGESLALHGLLILAMTAFVHAVKPPAKVIPLDLAMLEQLVAPALGGESEKKDTATPPTPQEPEVVQPKKPPATAPKKAAKPQALPAKTSPPPEPTENVSESAPSTETATTSAAEMPTTLPAPAEPGAARPAVSAAALYRSANFNAIRSAILAKLRYPPLARRKGWAGKVEIAFTILPDGGIDDLRIAVSSGYPVLDEQAAEAVRHAAPFTPPPETARLVMPVTFQLD